MNKLLLEKRYENVLQLAELEIADLKSKAKTDQKTNIGGTLSNLIGHAVYELVNRFLKFLIFFLINFLHKKL